MKGISITILALAFSAFRPVGSTALGQSPIDRIDSDVSVRLSKLALELKGVSYPIDYDELLTRVHRYSGTDVSLGVAPPQGTDGPFYSFLMLKDVQRSTLEDYLIEIVYRVSKARHFEVIKTRLCMRSKSGYLFYWDDQEPSFFPIRGIGGALRPAR